MSAEILYFTPSAELGAVANLAAFIELCRKSEVLDASRQFSKNIWEAGYLKGQNKRNRIVFSTMEAAKDVVSEPAMSQPFLDFAKAALIYLQDKKKVVSFGNRIAALRFLDGALREWSKASRPTAVNEDVLDTAVELARKQISSRSAYRVAGQLQLIAELMRSKGFISLRQSWEHGLKRPREDGSRISKEALSSRQEKMPSAAALRALAYIFHQAIEPVDVLISSFTALMLCAPERINEVLRLVRNCLVEGDGRFAGKLGLRWAGSKGFDDTTKWLPTRMVPIAREAIANLIRVTAPAQRLADWYTANPKTLFLHEDAEHLRGKAVLSLSEVAFILWGDECATQQANDWAQKTKKLPKIQISARLIGFYFDDVQRAVISMLPKTFPYVPGAPELLCKNAIAIIPKNGMHSGKSNFLCMFSCIDYNALTSHLGKLDRYSIFERFKFTEDDGSRIELLSHSLRHYLNMLAQIGGLSSAEVAILSGRKDERQNRPYDHMSSDEVQAPISEALKAGFTANLVPVGTRNIIVRSEFKNAGALAAHTTEYGWCMHNFASEPCQMYRDCINCEEQVCVKGDEHKESNLRLLLEETQYLLMQAREALNDEEYGADTWVEHQTKTLERVTALLSVLDNPEVPVGARVRLNLANAALITSATKVIPADKRKLFK